ncbi:MAG TPA: hypothetical protein VF958_01585, partial [Thermoanaerobaculia bacterium]
MRGRALLLVAFASVAWGCAGAPVSAPPAPPKSRAPYAAPPAARHQLEITIDARAARDLLAFLSRPDFQP